MAELSDGQHMVAEGHHENGAANGEHEFATEAFHGGFIVFAWKNAAVQHGGNHGEKREDKEHDGCFTLWARGGIENGVVERKLNRDEERQVQPEDDVGHRLSSLFNREEHKYSKDHEEVERFLNKAYDRRQFHIHLVYATRLKQNQPRWITGVVFGT